MGFFESPQKRCSPCETNRSSKVWILNDFRFASPAGGIDKIQHVVIITITIAIISGIPKLKALVEGRGS